MSDLNVLSAHPLEETLLVLPSFFLPGLGARRCPGRGILRPPAQHLVLPATAETLQIVPIVSVVVVRRDHHWALIMAFLDVGQIWRGRARGQGGRRRCVVVLVGLIVGGGARGRGRTVGDPRGRRRARGILEKGMWRSNNVCAIDGF